MSDRRYRFDWDGITRSFPPGTQPPALLQEFGAWLDGRPWGSLGTFDLSGSFAEWAPIVDGSGLRKRFALFLHLPDGSVGGFWYPPGAAPERAPVVGLGSEGEAAVLGETLEAFLARIARNRFDDGGTWSDFAPLEDDDAAPGDPPALNSLIAWLQERLDGRDLEALASPPQDLSFEARMAAWNAERETYWVQHPTMIAMAGLLEAHRPRAHRPWDRTRFEVAIVGRQFEARVLRNGRHPFPEAAAIEPLLRALREEQAQAEPDLGLWSSMAFRMNAEGRILPSFDYDGRPTFGGVPALTAAARADLARFPRTLRWVPDWIRGQELLTKLPGTGISPSDRDSAAGVL
jgi:hypothetical protein